MTSKQFDRDSHRYIQDPIHGTIALSPMECDVIDHPLVQRLRGIKQLGNASNVFPGATHTRFCHSIGVMHQAGELFGALFSRAPHERAQHRSKKTSRITAKQSQDALENLHQLVRLAGLLHDLGHGPFSHHFEHFLAAEKLRVADLMGTDLAPPHQWLIQAQRQSYLAEGVSHEHISASLIARLGIPELQAQAIISLIDHRYYCGPLMEESLRAICCVLGGTGAAWPSLLACLRSLISSDIDADRMDYLRRDAHFCGISVTLDTPHLVRSISLAVHNGNFVIAIDRNAVFALEQLLLARKQMFSQVYQNRVNLLMDDLLSRAMEHARASGLLWVPRTVADFLAMDDVWLHALLRSLIHDSKVLRAANRSGDLALKMYLTRTLPVTLESREISITELKQVARNLGQKHRRGLVLSLPQKDLLAGENRPNGKGVKRRPSAAPVSPRQSSRKQGLADVLYTADQRSKPLLSVATVSELIRSNAWRIPSFRVIATEPLFESAIKRGLEAKVSVLLNTLSPNGSIQTHQGEPRNRKTASRA